jgi:hypothetical protein
MTVITRAWFFPARSGLRCRIEHLDDRGVSAVARKFAQLAALFSCERAFMDFSVQLADIRGGCRRTGRRC